jgi:rod shape-determining protein MreD
MNPGVPAVSVFLAVLATAVPWGLPADATFAPPLIVMTMIFCWRALPGTVFPSYLALLLGLLTDMLSGGPLGFWAMMALIAANAGGRAPSPGDAQARNRLWLFWGCVAAAIGLLAWLLGSLYVVQFIDAWPIAFGVGVSILLFPVVLRGVAWIKRGRLKAGIYRGFT